MLHFLAAFCDIISSDLGIARAKEEKTMTMVGTAAWTAPEVMRDSKYTEKADVFSFAIVMWEILTGVQPHQNLSTFEIISGVTIRGLRPAVPDTDTIVTGLLLRSKSANNNTKNDHSNSDKEKLAEEAEITQLVRSVNAYVQLMSQCWSDDTNARPTFATVVQTLASIIEEYNSSNKNNTNNDSSDNKNNISKQGNE